jgi:hypothetical protein
MSETLIPIDGSSESNAVDQLIRVRLSWSDDPPLVTSTP